MELDKSLLLAYCISYQNYIRYSNISQLTNNIIIDSNGNERISPYFIISDKSFNMMSSMAKVLGIGVRNRIGLDIKVIKEDSLMAQLLAKKSA